MAAPDHQGRVAKFLNRFTIEALFGRSHRPRHPRSVYVNQPLPDSFFDPKKGKILKEHVYLTNQVLTSKYTIITFLPRNLLEQFRRIANVFFAAIAILQFFPKFSTISPGLVILPLIAVLAITALKDGYEDIKRHQSDRRVNHASTQVLAGDSYQNNNVTAGKAKTFVRGVGRVIPRKSKPAPAELDIEKGEQKSSPADSTDGSLREESNEAYWKKVIWEDVRVGDFVLVNDNEQVPADLIICATSEDENVCFVETKNLDGETNLKSRNAVASLTALRTPQACADKNIAAFRVEAEKPDENMFRLNAKIVPNDPHLQPSPVDLQTTLLRGMILRNTKWVIGVALFTGEDAKIVMNSGGTPSKRSRVERLMNPQVLINLALLAVMAVACAIAEYFIDRGKTHHGAPWTFDENRSDDNPQINGLVTWANALITFQNVIPISLYISIEVVRTCQAAFIYFDKNIWYDKTDTATLARSWNLADDLGQIEYVFSDKTGTLTQNSMVFRGCSIGGKTYQGDPEAETAETQRDPTYPESLPATTDDSSNGVPSTLAAEKVALSQGVLHHFVDTDLNADLNAAKGAEAGGPTSSQARMLNGFFNVLALCHTVLAVVDPVTGGIEYKAQSPDEAALVQAAADVGFVFRGREREIMRLQTPFSDHVEEYELLNVLDFTSARKRMSVIVRRLDDEDHRLFLLCKGADNVIFERLRSGNDELRRKTENHLDEFANQGLRTLCLAYKVIPEEEYEAWSTRYHEASVALEDRDAQVEAVSSDMEADLRLLGATAIEDRLQDGVPETIADLKIAGIKVWVATGDKLETAIAIGYSTNLIARDSNLIVVRGSKDQSAYDQLARAADMFFPERNLLVEGPYDKAIHEKSYGSRPDTLRRINTGVSVAGEGNGSRPGGFILVIDGAALTDALEEETKGLLLRLSTQCEAVICCRVSPLQKALVVKLVKDGIGAVTLAIGDGANDVSMIQAADVGVGISGEEGLQAVNSSDYAIAQFRFLKRLLFVHGHWSYSRNANMILNFFYKNIVCIGVLWWFQIYCAWSTQYVFDYTYLLFWNVFWSLATVIAIGIFDRMIDADILMALPELYREGREGKWFGTKLFSLYMLDAVYQSAVIYFFTLYAYDTVSSRTDGYDVSRIEFSTTMVISAVMVVNAFNGLNTYAWSGWVWFAVLIGPVLVWLFTVVYSAIAPGWFYTDVYGNNHYLFRAAYYWFCLILTFFISLLPRYVLKAAKTLYAPSDIDILRTLRKTHPEIDILNHPLLGGRHKHAGAATSAATSEEDLNRFPPPSRITPNPLAAGSRTDMSTGQQSVHRGFDFATEEEGVSMRRIQTNLSERQSERKHGLLGGHGWSSKHGHGSRHLFPSIRRSMRRRHSKVPSTSSPPDSPTRPS
ncbi:phospholipid-translocating P-type ATPase [Sistotremastrum suecicum HHB10207 ss-3]|uniref:Phospholipid-transporting ATPase n=1 Tax=Sistotremastrum suecicum HHB10207 ss-3 TaxID=1314776 RepID=A0A166AMR8_9AGAM|nr:phospholipid-translocating P-type ATPase [Sistotremastrum suecicum HHB10207 ss-3]